MVAAQGITNEVRMTILEDVCTALLHLARDSLPTTKPITCEVQKDPPAVALRVAQGSIADPALEAALHKLAAFVKAGTDETFPSLPLQYSVIVGTEATGIEVIPDPAAEPVYGHVIKAKLAYLRPSAALRRLRPNLPERIDL